MSKERRRSGLLLGVGAYASWGLFPAFFPLLKPASAFEILAHRIVWCFVLMVVVIAAVRRLGDIRAITPRTWLLLTFASALISVNWVIYIYAVNNGHVVDAALGYFINPLVTVALGLLVFRERLNRAQFAALAIAVIAVVVLTVEVGSPPVIGLGLALSFGLYGAVKKVVPTDPRVSVGVEAGVAAPFALAYIVVLQGSGEATFANHGPGHVALMVLSGVLTAVPLLLFAAAAQRLPLVTMGLLFYLTPAMQLTWGVVVGHEPMPPARWLGFGLIWVALAVFSADALWRARVDRRAVESSYRRQHRRRIGPRRNRVMRYCLLMHYQEGTEVGLTEEDMAPAMAAFQQYADDLSAAGVLIGTEVLESVVATTTVTARSGAAEIQDGPFADTKEKLGGIFVIEVDNLDEALKWAQRNPANAWGSIEIRPVARTYAADRGWYNP